MHEFGTLYCCGFTDDEGNKPGMLIRLLPSMFAVQVPSFQIGVSLAVQILQCVRGVEADRCVVVVGRSFVLMQCTVHQ
jgi:hypothetical protein